MTTPVCTDDCPFEQDVRIENTPVYRSLKELYQTYYPIFVCTFVFYLANDHDSIPYLMEAIICNSQDDRLKILLQCIAELVS